MTRPFIVSTIYPPEDHELHDELLMHLAPLQRGGWLKILSKNDILPGGDQEDCFKIIERSNIVLVLMSSSFYKPVDFPLLESLVVHARQKDRQIMVSIILLRTCMFEADPILKDLPVLPQNGNDVSHSSWGGRDYAWKDVAYSIKKQINKIEHERLERIEGSVQIHGLDTARYLIISGYPQNRYRIWINRIKKFIYQ